MEHQTAPASRPHHQAGEGNKALRNLLDTHLEKVLPNPAKELTLVEEGLAVFQLRNATNEPYTLELPMAREIIQFMLVCEGTAQVNAGPQEEKLTADPKTIVQCSYPFEPWVLQVEMAPGAMIWSLLFSIETLHAFFGSGFGANREDFEVFLKSYKQKKHFSQVENTPALNVCFYQIFNNSITEGLRRLYQKSKVTEFLTLYLNKPRKDNALEASCPFVNDEEEISRIKKARSIMEDQLSKPPGLKELARMVGTNEFKLKVGFKNLYGNTVFGYLGDLRMQKARELLEVRKLHIQEVASLVGYSNPSHFIAAYKKKFGVTPKQYLKSTQ
jgi:AraC-like DNA-binding protein